MQFRTVLLAAVCLIGYVTAEEKIADDGAQERLIALRSTFTSIRFSTTTTTGFFTCGVSTNVACTGRRKRALPRRDALPESSAVLASSEMASPALESSMGAKKAVDATDPNGRLLFTIWTTSFSTLTTISTSTNFATTVSFQYGCTVAGQSLFPEC